LLYHDRLGFFWRRAAPLLAVSVARLAVVYGLAWARGASGLALVSLALLAASVVTLPHALLVTLGLDMARWRPSAPARHLPERVPIATSLVTTSSIPA